MRESQEFLRQFAVPLSSLSIAIITQQTIARVVCRSTCIYDTRHIKKNKTRSTSKSQCRSVDEGRQVLGNAWINSWQRSAYTGQRNIAYGLLIINRVSFAGEKGVRKLILAGDEQGQVNACRNHYDILYYAIQHKEMIVHCMEHPLLTAITLPCLERIAFGNIQWAFTKGLSCRVLVSMLMLSWILCICTGKKRGAWPSDISDAFAKVSKEYLFAKLREFGIALFVLNLSES